MTTPSSPALLASSADYEALVGAAPARLNLDVLLAAASDLVRTECGWHIAPEIVETVTVDGPGGSDLMLPTLRLVELVAVTDYLTPLDPLDIEWSTAGYLRLAWCWSTRLRGVQVTMNHGYQAVPAGLIALVCTVAARAAASPGGVVREQVGPVSQTYSQVGSNVAGGTALLTHEREYLTKFKIPARP